MQPELNSANQVPDIAVLPASGSVRSPSPTSAIENQNSKIQNPSERRCRGKIARLPKPLRDLVNRLLDDGQPYRIIIQKLEASTDPPLPYPVIEMDISRWYNKGYQRLIPGRVFISV